MPYRNTCISHQSRKEPVDEAKHKYVGTTTYFIIMGQLPKLPYDRKLLKEKIFLQI